MLEKEFQRKILSKVMGIPMNFIFSILLLVLGFAGSVQAQDYEVELKLIEKVDHLRDAGLSSSAAKEQIYIGVKDYYKVPVDGFRGDRILFALDEFYHERLLEILNLYIEMIPHIDLEKPNDQEMKEIAGYLFTAAQIPEIPDFLRLKEAP